MKNQTDEQILRLLKQDPQRGMNLLVESYTGLIWKVISFHLKNPEDIKECVNDTFASFYYHRKSFDTSKASLSVYLTAIARNTAISHYRKEKKHSLDSALSEVPAEDTSLLLAETKADLSRALDMLKPNELQIIRMKYYGGMTIAEIADSLNLPYETVKKRHQRSLLRLRHNLFLVLLLLLIMLFSIGTYAVLRHFEIIPPLFFLEESTDTDEDDQELENTSNGTYEKVENKESENPKEDQQASNLTNSAMASPDVGTVSDASAENDSDTRDKEVQKNYTYIPEYGIKEASSGSSYMLSSVVSAEDEATKISVTYASLIGKKLKITVTALSKTKPFSVDPSEWDEKLEQKPMRFADGTTHKLYYHGTHIPCGGGGVHDQENRYIETCSFETNDFEPLDSDKDLIPFTIHCYDLDISFSLSPAKEESITENNIYQMKDYGGILLVPRLEDGSLKIAIHPLNKGDLITLPGLIRGPHGELQEDGVVTVTDQDGNTLTGTCIRYYPGSSSTYFEWDFGEANPGNYSLHIPFLLQIPKSGEKVSIPIDFTNQTCEGKKYPIPGGKIWVSNITAPYELPEDHPYYDVYKNAIKFWGTKDYPNAFLDNPDSFTYQNFTITGEANDAQHRIAGIYGDITCDVFPGMQDYGYIGREELSNDYASQSFTYMAKFLTGYKDPSTAQFHLLDRVEFGYTNTPAYYRWNEIFDFTFTVE